ncbi:MAG: hypothetical protein ABEK16_06545 [Candidatus Nanohalobium sp.]
MSILNNLKDALGREEEPLELEKIVDAERVFRRERSEELDRIAEESERFRERTKSAVEELKTDLKDLEDFDDHKQRAIVEDNIENFVGERLRILEDFSAPENVEELDSELEVLLREFNSMSQKQGAVLEEASVANEFSESLEELTELHEEVQEFIEDEYRTRERFEEVRKKLQEMKELKGELESIDSDREKEIEELEQEIKRKKQGIEQLEDSAVHTEYREKQEDLEDSREQRDEILKDIGKSMGRMERGLKKMLHEGKIGKVSSKGSEALRSIRDGEKQELLNYDPEVVEEAANSVEESVEGDFLDSTTRQRLLQGVSYFKNFSGRKEKLENLQEKITSLEDEIESHEYMEDRRKMRKEKERLERELEDARKESRNLEDRQEEIESEIEDLKSEVMELMREEFDRKVEKG